jgi:hypothetical protein
MAAASHARRLASSALALFARQREKAAGTMPREPRSTVK